MSQFEIYFSDLNIDAQKRLCEEFSTTPKEENWDLLDIAPLCILEREDDD